MTNSCTDEIVFFRKLTKISIDENKAIYSSQLLKDEKTKGYYYY